MTIIVGCRSIFKERDKKTAIFCMTFSVCLFDFILFLNKISSFLFSTYATWGL